MRTANSVEKLLQQTQLFEDPERPSCENEGPHIVVIDDFYSEPDAIRRLALAQDYVQYEPPLENQVSSEVYERYRGLPGCWFSTVLTHFHGSLVRNPIIGFRYAPEILRRHFEDLLSEKISEKLWDLMGDNWNGAFHYLNKFRGLLDVPAVHHHYKDDDVTPRGWSGVVYLSPDSLPGAGTSFWCDKRTGRCVAGKGAKFDYDVGRFELALEVEGKFNRLVLFRENVLHRGGIGFGSTPEDARLFQTFFFVSQKTALG